MVNNQEGSYDNLKRTKLKFLSMSNYRAFARRKLELIFNLMMQSAVHHAANELSVNGTQNITIVFAQNKNSKTP